MPRIFISYRRSDSQAITGRIYDRLIAAFGQGNIFKDVDRIPPGSTFAEVLEAELNKCNVLLVIIGRSWASIQNEAGRKRLDDPEDFVRVEVEKGLHRNDLLVVPVLVDDASIPHSNDLPDSLDQLVSLQVVKVRHDPDFHRDMNRLIDFLQILQQQETAVQDRERGQARRNMRRTLSGFGILAALIIVAVIIGIARGIIQISPTPMPTLDERQAAMQLVMTFTAEAVALQATATPNATMTIEAIITGFVTETSAAQAALNTSTQTPTNTLLPSDTPTETPTATDTPTPTENAVATADAQATVRAGEATGTQAAINVQATSAAQATLNVPTGTPEPTATPTNPPINTSVPTPTPTYTDQPTLTLTPTQPPTATLMPTPTENVAATVTAEAAAATQAAIDARATFAVRQTQTQSAIDAYTNTPTATLTEAPALGGGGGLIAIETGAFTCEIVLVDVERAEIDSEIKVCDPENTSLTIDWLQNGSELVISDFGTGLLYYISTDGNNRRTFQAPQHFSGSELSPDGSQLVASYDREIVLMTLEGEVEQTLVDDTLRGYGPSWSPDGEQIVFRGNPVSGSGIYVVNRDGSDLHRLTVGHHSCPTFSPDGTQIMYLDSRTGTNPYISNEGDIYAMDADGSNPRNLTNSGDIEWCGSWSPDGEWIAFMSNRSSSGRAYYLFIMDKNGENIRRLTDQTCVQCSDAPAWQP
jgi:hypothetical protein